MAKPKVDKIRQQYLAGRARLLAGAGQGDDLVQLVEHLLYGLAYETEQALAEEYGTALEEARRDLAWEIHTARARLYHLTGLIVPAPQLDMEWIDSVIREVGRDPAVPAALRPPPEGGT